MAATVFRACSFQRNDWNEKSWPGYDIVVHEKSIYLIATIICEYKILRFWDCDDLAGTNFCNFNTWNMPHGAACTRYPVRTKFKFHSWNSQRSTISLKITFSKFLELVMAREAWWKEKVGTIKRERLYMIQSGKPCVYSRVLDMLVEFFCGYLILRFFSESQKFATFSTSNNSKNKVDKFKCLEAKCREKPWKSPGSNLRHQIA